DRKIVGHVAQFGHWPFPASARHRLPIRYRELGARQCPTLARGQETNEGAAEGATRGAAGARARGAARRAHRQGHGARPSRWRAEVANRRPVRNFPAGGVRKSQALDPTAPPLRSLEKKMNARVKPAHDESRTTATASGYYTRHMIANSLLRRSVTSMLPGEWVMQNSGLAVATTDCGVTPQAQNTGISSACTGTGSPQSGRPRSLIPIISGLPIWTGAPCTDGYRIVI